jgi:hypothetical protein
MRSLGSGHPRVGAIITNPTVSIVRHGPRCPHRSDQSPYRRSVHAIRPRDVGLRLPGIEAGQRFLPLEWRKFARPAEPDAALLRPLSPSPVLARISSRSNCANPPRTVSIRRPWGLVVSAQASFSERKPAPRLDISSMTFLPEYPYPARVSRLLSGKPDIEPDIAE